MKRIVIAMSIAFFALWGAVTLAASPSVGTVNLQQILQQSAQTKAINKKLDAQFSDRRKALDTMAASLKSDIEKLQKNQSVMDSKTSNALKEKIVKEESEFRAKQAAFQHALFDAQNKALKGFMNQVHAAAKEVAVQKKLDLVLSNNGVLYNKDSVDITSAILKMLNK